MLIEASAEDRSQYEVVKDRQTPDARLKAIRRAVEAYTDGRPYFVDAENAVYDAVNSRDSFGQIVRRWGYYKKGDNDEGKLGLVNLQRETSDLGVSDDPDGCTATEGQ